MNLIASLLGCTILMITGCVGNNDQPNRGGYEYDFKGEATNLQGDGERDTMAFNRPNLIFLEVNGGLAAGAYEGYDGPSLILILRSADLEGHGRQHISVDGQLNEAWLIKGWLSREFDALKNAWQEFVDLDPKKRAEVSSALLLTGEVELTRTSDGTVTTIYVDLESKEPMPAPPGIKREESPVTLRGKFIRYWNTGKTPWWWI